MHLAFHGPYSMAALMGRYLNTLRTVVYEWEGESTAGPSYIPVIVFEQGVTDGPITGHCDLAESADRIERSAHVRFSGCFSLSIRHAISSCLE